MKKIGREGVPLLAAGVILLAGCLIGGGMVKESQKDYSSYTERTTAVVSAVEEYEDSDGDDRERYFVDFTAEGQEFSHQSLRGSHSGEPEVGDEFVLAYPPGDPEKAVTESRLDARTGHIFLAVGLGIMALTAVIFVLILIRFLWQTGRIGPGAREPVTAAGSNFTVPAPADPAALPVPWPWEQVAAHLVHAARATPYAVSVTAQAIEVTVDIGNAQWSSAFQQHGFESAYVVRLSPRKDGRRYTQTDTMYDIDWTGGVGRFTGRGHTQSGRSWSRKRRVEYGFGQDGRFGKQLDVNFNSSDLQGWVRQVLEPSGWKPRLDNEARGAVVFAIIGGGGAVVALVTLALLGKLG